jgi:hypothetical protein
MRKICKHLVTFLKMGCFLLIKRSVDIHLKVYCLDNELPKRTNKYLMVSLSLSLSFFYDHDDLLFFWTILEGAH